MNLGRNYRFAVNNQSGVTVAVTINARRWKWGADGSRTDEAAETEVFNASGIASSATAYTTGGAIDNGADKWLGGELEVTATPTGTGGGPVAIYLQHSTDGGVTWDTTPHALVGVINLTTSTPEVKVLRVGS